MLCCVNALGQRYHSSSLVETKMRCFKLGQRFAAQTFDRQITFSTIRAATLDYISQTGTPKVVRGGNCILDKEWTRPISDERDRPVFDITASVIAAAVDVLRGKAFGEDLSAVVVDVLIAAAVESGHHVTLASDSVVRSSR